MHESITPIHQNTSDLEYPKPLQSFTHNFVAHVKGEITFFTLTRQSQDYHLDRALFFACKSDREIFCEKVISGDGRVYTCLLRNKMVSADTDTL